MKHFRFFSLALLLLTTVYAASAYDFNVEGYYYTKTSSSKVAIDVGDNPYSGVIDIPIKITVDGVDYAVTSIADEAFKDCSGIIRVDIPSTVTSIGDDAFSGCSYLSNVTLSTNLTSIGENAFNKCYALEELKLPNTYNKYWFRCIQRKWLNISYNSEFGKNDRG